VATDLTDLAMNKENLNIVFTSKYFQPESETFDKRFVFVDPSIYPRNHTADFLKELTSRKKVLYISIGTVNNDNLAFYHLCIETFKNTPYQVILSLGHRFTVDHLPEVPNNFIIRNYIPQLY